MGLSLKLFVHGVPDGQRVWGAPGDARPYIDTFYGRKGNDEAQLIVEVMPEAGTPFCYYTYMRNRNILAADGRPGSYVALTVRVNAYYADIRNMYAVLDAAYRKMIVGTVLIENASSTRFHIQDFKQADTQLHAVEEQIVRFVSNFSVHADFIDLNIFPIHVNAEPVCLNLLDCDPGEVLKLMKRTGKVAVSPAFPTTKFADILSRKDAELKNLRTVMQQQLSATESKAAQDLQAVLRDKNDAVNAANVKYTAAANQSKELESTLKATREHEAHIADDLKSAQHELDRVNQYKAELKKAVEAKKQSDKEIERLNKLIHDAHTALANVPGIDTLLGCSSAPQGDNYRRQAEDSPWMIAMHRYSPMASIILAGALVVVVVLALMGMRHAQKASDEKVKMADAQIVQLTDDLESAHAQLDENDVNASESGRWTSDDFKVSGDILTPKHTGRCVVNYVVGDRVVKSLTIHVAK